MSKTERITLADNQMSIVMKMSEGNPGAMNVLMNMMQDHGIDPDSALGGIGSILTLDTIGIYGSDIYVLNKDICDQDLPKMLAVLRATQLGMFDREVLKDACSRQDRSGKQMVPVNELYEKVRERLPNFNKVAHEQSR